MSFFESLAIEEATRRGNTDAPLSPVTRQAADTLQQIADEYYEDVQTLEAQIRAINSNPQLSAQGRRDRRLEVVTTWDEEATRAISDATHRAQKKLRSLERGAQLPALDRDSKTAEARAGNARRDAELLLGNVPQRELFGRMADLAESDQYPDVRHLLVAGSWGHLYLNARGVMETAEWEQARLARLRPMLSKDAAQELDDLLGFREAAKIPTSLKNMHARNRVRYGATAR